MSKISKLISDSEKVTTKKAGKPAVKEHINHPSQKINQEVNRPSHYGAKSGKDVIDWCEDFGIMTNAYIFNIFKYLCRAGKKNNNSELQDALKAKIYLERYIEKLQSK